jgi:D-alanyl-D-alanine carboxypeptidase/D-alanyl-D-alanine-endopeptidase (penicillin-binding protein 4)
MLSRFASALRRAPLPVDPVTGSVGGLFLALAVASAPWPRAHAQEEPASSGASRGAAEEAPPSEGLPPDAQEGPDTPPPPLPELPEGPPGIDVVGPFQAMLQPVLQEAALRRTTVGIQVTRVSSGEEVFSWQPDRALLPASTTKLVTSAAALDALGPSYAFSTDVLVDGPIVGGVLQGNLYLRGHADPTLVAEKIWRLLKDVHQDGVDRITGDIVLDDSFFDEGWIIPGWNNQEDLDRGVTYFPPVGALASDFGAITLVVRPGAEPGQPAVAEVATDAPGYVTIVNEAVTARSDSRTRISVERRVRDDAVTFKVSGTIALNASSQRHRRTMSDPTAYTMAVVRGLLDDVGIQLLGSLRKGVTPNGARSIHKLYSPPLSSVLMDTNKYSSNFMAEMVLRTLGAEKHGAGTTANGVRAVTDYLDEIGVPRSDYAIRNGSGLSRETHIAPSVLTAVLLDMAHNPIAGPEFIASLAIGGRDGTLVSRMDDLVGRVRAKTGTLGGVHCLAGYVEGDDHELYAFVFFVNDVRGSIDAVKAVQDDFLSDLAEIAGQ